MTDDRQPFRRSRTRDQEVYGKRYRTKGVCMTRAQIEAWDGSMPAGFTGNWRGAYFYRGTPWSGPSNAIGAGR